MTTHNDQVRAAIAKVRRLTVLRLLAEVPAEHRMRLHILNLLALMPGYSSNTSEIDLALDAMDLAVSRQEVRAAGAWLAQHALVTREDLGAADTLAATRTGLDVADGATAVAGVARPATIAWLQEGLARWGIAASQDDVAGWVADLAAAPALVIALDQVTITARGEDVAAGLQPDARVAKPSPRD